MTRNAGPSDEFYYTSRYQDDRDWMKAAPCRDHDPKLWFNNNDTPGRPNHQEKQNRRKAKQICDSCPVRVTCLIYSLDMEIAYGMYGGVTEEQRRILLKRRKAR